jgi:hypothetical protein
MLTVGSTVSNGLTTRRITMIVGANFVWLHFPKCAGHAVEQALRLGLRGRRDVSFDKRWPHHPGWHDSVADRARRQAEFRSDGKVVICGFRRLPHWMLSRVYYEASRPPYHSPTREMICRGEFLHQNGEVGAADQHALHYGGSGVDRWIRTEHLVEDFQRHFSDILGSGLTNAAARKVRRIANGARMDYIRSLAFHFTSDDLDSLYAANPIWAGIERDLYGDVLRL